ncbi:Trypanosome variant surface glycoprotein (A-type), putative [Trypanosoma equiperdum]|uniref:Trypanosome variant surface glycoprotein (A-type), putative n=1 Tax=Trypanosoma equiperdum TaxID=5694 RepID=A0A1G4IG17_TRYEQ|nr:Trypanosome variant surface glycoprotein (A-type), putative [Trypanosoma equiperdum]
MALQRQLRRRLLCVAVALSLIAEQRTEGGKGPALSSETRTRLCNLNTKIAKFPAYVTKKVTTAEQAREQLLVDSLKLQIYMRIIDSESAALAAPLAAATADVKLATAEADKRHTKQTNNAISYLAFLRASLTEFLTIAADLHQSGGTGAGCLALSRTTMVQGAAALGTCGGTMEEANTGGADLTKLTTDGFTELSSTEGSTRLVASTAKCGLFVTNSSGGPLGGQETARTPKLAGGYITLDATSATRTLSDLTDLKAGKDATAPKAFSKAYNAYKAIKHSATLTPFAHKRTTTSQINLHWKPREHTNYLLLEIQRHTTRAKTTPWWKTK